MIHPNDLLLLVGKSSVLESVYRAIKKELGQFPEPYGMNILLYIDMKIDTASKIVALVDKALLAHQRLKHNLIIRVVNPSDKELLRYIKDQVSESVSVKINYDSELLRENFLGLHLEQIEAVTEYVKETFDNPKIFISGNSFGGYSLIMNAVKNPGLYSGAISINGLHDFANSAFYNGTPHEITAQRMWNYLLGANPAENTELNEKMSTRYQARSLPSDFPIMIVAGEQDVIVDIEQSRFLAETLRESGHTNVTFLEMPNSGHTIDFDDELFKNSFRSFIEDN
jgi:predicted esterase